MKKKGNSFTGCGCSGGPRLRSPRTWQPKRRAGGGLYRQRTADLVITDICMPTLDGLDLMIELTREFLNVKVIAMSGTRELLGRAKLLGARQPFHKPFDMKELLSAVKYELAH